MAGANTADRQVQIQPAVMCKYTPWQVQIQLAVRFKYSLPTGANTHHGRCNYSWPSGANIPGRQGKIHIAGATTAGGQELIQIAARCKYTSRQVHIQLSITGLRHNRIQT